MVLGEKVEEKQPPCPCPPLPLHHYPPTHFPTRPPKNKGVGGKKEKEKKSVQQTNLGKCGICILIFPKKKERNLGMLINFQPSF